MNFETWIAYVIACSILSIIPGPSVLLVTAQAMNKGLKAAVVCVVGESLGGSILILSSLLGVGAVLAASATLFVVVKWLGVIYLAYLGVREILLSKKNARDFSSEELDKKYGNSFIAGFFTALLNPKAIIFYMAFISQFVNPMANLLLQYAILITTSAVVASAILLGYALVASRAQSIFKGKNAKRNVGYASGSFYLSGSILMATAR